MIKTISFLSLIAMSGLALIGARSLKAVHMHKPNLTKRTFKKNSVRLAIHIVFLMMISHFCHEAKHIIDHHNDGPKDPKEMIKWDGP